MVFRQEYLAEFLSGDGAVFRNVDNCLTAVPSMPIAHRGSRHRRGRLGAVARFTAISLSVVIVSAKWRDRFNQIGWAFQRERLLSLMNHWSVKHALIESNSIGSPNLEALHEHLPQGAHSALDLKRRRNQSRS